MGDILLKVNGDGFEKNKYDLRSCEKVIVSYRQILDGVLPLSIGQRPVSDKIKSEVKYEIEFKPGSLEIWLDFVPMITGTLITAASTDGGYLIAQRVSTILSLTLNLRRLYTDLLKKDKKPKIGLINSPELKVELKNVKTDGGNINISPIIMISADQTRVPLDKLIGSVDGHNIDNILLRSEESETNITTADRRIIGTQKEELPHSMDIFGRLDSAAFTAHRGVIVTGTGRFPVFWEDDLRTKIRTLVDIEGIAFRAQPIIDHRRFKDDPVAFKLLDCWNPQDNIL